MQKQAKGNKRTVISIVVAALWLVIIALFAFWYERTMPRWEMLPAPPSKITELLPPSQGIRVRAENGQIYRNEQWQDITKTTWILERIAPPPQSSPLASPCTVETLPDSWLGSRPQPIENCYAMGYYKISFVALDNQQQLWVWANDDEPVTIILIGGALLILLFTLLPLLLIGFKLFNRATIEIPVAT